MQIKAVVFDLDDTLIHPGIDYSGVKSSVIKFLVKLGITEGLLNENMSNLDIISRMKEDLRRKNFDEVRIREIISDVYIMFSEAELRSVDKARLMDETLEILGTLKSLGLKIGVVTNSCSAYAKKILEMFSLNEYIDVLVTRDDVSHHKLDQEHLLKALRALGVGVSEVVFVGDHLIDSLCAKNSNVRFILLRGERRHSREAEKNALTVIDHLSELLPPAPATVRIVKEVYLEVNLPWNHLLMRP
ncbi:MAG: HAD family hydrolase [Candidatus Bathyarchaeia archaeon]